MVIGFMHDIFIKISGISSAYVVVLDWRRE